MSVVTNLHRLKQDLMEHIILQTKQPVSQLNEEIIHISWNLNIHNRVHKNDKPLVPIMSQGDGFFILTSYFFEFRFSIVLLIKPVSSK